MIRSFIVIVGSCFLVACGGTTVVLVPDANGKVGQVEVMTQAGSTVLSKANESAIAKSAEEKPDPAVQFSEHTVHQQFAKLLAAEPLAPEHYKFYFESGRSELKPEAKVQLDKAKATIDTRHSCDVSVIGHSDTVGTNALNKGISLDRAKAVLTALTTLGVDKKCMDLRYYGENDLAVPTSDEVDEPLNRRVEIEIR